MPDETCTKVLSEAKDYWTTASEKRTLLYGWLEEHLVVCEECAVKIQDVAEEMLDERRK